MAHPARPPARTGLTALKKLNMSGLAQLEDEFLQPLAGLPRLRELVLDRCSGLTGEGLGELERAPALRVLSLLECQVRCVLRSCMWWHLKESPAFEMFEASWGW